jgi:hypothetical protein
MKRLWNKRKWIGGLSALLLLMPVAVRTIHLCLYSAQEEIIDSHHDCSTCPICLFILSPFTEGETDENNCPVQPVCYAIILYPEEPCSPVFRFYDLRAPPTPA